MTSRPAVCLRCDWEGTSLGGAPCPSCGVGLYVWTPQTGEGGRGVGGATSLRGPVPTQPPLRDVAPPSSSGVTLERPAGARADRRGAWPPPRARITEHEAREGDEVRTGSWVRAISVVAGLALVAAAVVVVARTPGGSTGASRSSAGMRGILVYASDESDGASRLYRWDLGDGRVEPGPRVPGLVSLVDASAAHPGWVGVTSRLRHGSLRASFLSSLRPDSPLEPLVSGDLVAWGGGGLSVAAVREGREVGGCRRRMTVIVDEVTIGAREVPYHAVTCDRIVSLGRDVAVTYLTLRGGGRTSVDFVGYHVLHEVLADHALVSVSPTSDMLVIPENGVGIRPTDSTVPPSAGAALFFRGLGALNPLPFADGRQPLELSSFLAWSTDASEALVTGRLGPREGIWELPLGPGTAPRLPVFVSKVPGPVWATFEDDGTGLVAMGGQVYGLHDHTLEPMSLPAGAPLPSGPVVWLH